MNVSGRWCDTRLFFFILFRMLAKLPVNLLALDVLQRALSQVAAGFLVHDRLLTRGYHEASA